VRITSPASIAGLYEFGTASFGAVLTSPGISGQVVAAVDPADGAGPTTTDGCSPFTNAADVAGKIALVERGTCTFIVKAQNATAAGAAAVLIYNNAANAAAAAPALGGTDTVPPTVTIVALGLGRATGLAIVNQLLINNPVQATLGVNDNIYAGADQVGHARLYMPTVVASGSTASHYDTIAFRNLLMEPAINPDLTHELTAPADLTLELMRDIGWFADADLDGVADDTDCEPNSDLSATVTIQSCNTGVSNTLFADGCTVADNIAHAAASAGNHGNFVSAATQYADQLKKNHLINGNQQAAIVACAAGSTLP